MPSFYEVSEHSVISGEETEDFIKLSSLGSQDGNANKFDSEKANKTDPEYEEDLRIRIQIGGSM